MARYAARFAAVAALVVVISGATCGSRPGGATVPAASGNPVPASQSGILSPAVYTCRVAAIFPHDTKSYTQGLYWHEGHLWEGTGLYGQSALKKVDLKTGKALQSVALPRKYFGEGIALLDGKIYQLTWLEHTAFVYDAATLEKRSQFEYYGEGWGLTTDGKWLYMSNGTNEIATVDPVGFTRKSVVSVTLEGRPLNYLNELEWIDGRIWANVYTSDMIAIIDPATGVVEGVVDLSGLLPASDRTPDTDVLNGIAYDREGGRIFVTGKNWPKLFQIEIVKK